MRLPPLSGSITKTEEKKKDYSHQEGRRGSSRIISYTSHISIKENG
jgi:hypothetical protein